jgi:hypothetical protein
LFHRALGVSLAFTHHYNRVNKMKSMIILAGGSSVRGLPQDIITERLPDLAFTIGVNDSAIYAEVDLAVSMDRLWCENRWKRIIEKSTQLLARTEALKNIPGNPLITSFKCDYRSTLMSMAPGILNGTNSGMVALNYAFQKRPKKVFLLGLDSGKTKDQTTPYWYPSYPWAAQSGATKPGKYRDWNVQYGFVRRQFAREGMDVFTVGATNTDAFTNISFRQFISMVSENDSNKVNLPVLQQPKDAGATG